MFSNFVTFQEVVKLSKNVFWKMREINYQDKLLDLIYSKKDAETFETALDLIEDKELLRKFINIIEIFCGDFVGEKWVENIFKVIRYFGVNSIDNRTLNKWMQQSSNCKNYNFLKYFVENGADIHFQNESALRSAAECGNLETVKYLVKHGANIHSGNVDGDALDLAIFNSHLEIVKYLVNNGASLDTDQVITDLAIADNLEMIMYFAERPDCKTCEKECSHRIDIQKHDYILIKACQSGNIDIVEYLVSKGTDVRSQSNLALRIAAKHGQLKMIKYLVTEGANIYEKRNRALNTAIKYGYFDVVKYLLKYGCEIQREKIELSRPLNKGHLEVIQYLIEQNAFN